MIGCENIRTGLWYMRISRYGQVEEALQRYRREHDEYPRGYEELNQLLPADTPPLEQHDIISYSRNGPGFRLEIRAKKPPYSTFRIEKTGLLR